MKNIVGVDGLFCQGSDEIDDAVLEPAGVFLSFMHNYNVVFLNTTLRGLIII